MADEDFLSKSTTLKKFVYNTVKDKLSLLDKDQIKTFC